eukprot:3618157-Rhodomonas_salina.1
MLAASSQPRKTNWTQVSTAGCLRSQHSAKPHSSYSFYWEGASLSWISADAKLAADLRGGAPSEI